MKLAVGLVLSPGYQPPTEFWLGRPGKGEGYIPMRDRLQSGDVNRSLPEHLKITDLRQITSNQFPTDVARNEICAGVLKDGLDYLLFLDCDMTHPVDLVERLLSADKPVITARYHQKKPPFACVGYVKHPTQAGPHRYITVHFGRGVIEIERGGAGALLIRRDVLQAIYDRIGHNWFRYQRGPEAPHDFKVSEDFWFFQQAREAGFKTYMDWDCECGHVANMVVDRTWNEPFLHKQVGEYGDPEKRDLVLQNTVVLGYPDGMYLGDTEHVPEYVVTGGER